MTRKHFQMIAEVIQAEVAIAKQHKDKDATLMLSTLGATARGLALKFREANPRFDPDIFMAACGFPR